MKISFCIPSLNRPDYLIETIRSICSDTNYRKEFEVIIYNNNSELSYENVERVIADLSQTYNIKYFIGDDRLDIDNSMLNAILPAKGEYLFLIGDDDFLDQDGLLHIFNLLEGHEFDMAVFNAKVINEVQGTKTNLIGFSGKEYEQLSQALLDLKNYCSYGNLLLKRRFLIKEDFNYLLGTSHAYGAFWLAFFKDFENGINPIIIVPEASVVNLRVTKKNYNLLQVIFKHAAFEYSLYFKTIGPESRKILQIYVDRYWESQSSLINLIRLGTIQKLIVIKEYNPWFYKRFNIKIAIARIILFLILPFKKNIRFIIKVLSRNNNKS